VKIELIRDARPQGNWLSVDQMIDDLKTRRLELQPGDKLFVTEGVRPRLSVVRDRPRPTLATSND
jgi:hypothetical protein